MYVGEYSYASDEPQWYKDELKSRRKDKSKSTIPRKERKRLRRLRFNKNK